jgi:magnesium chelatase family protein
LQRYRTRISGPLLDRIDIQVEVPAVRYRDLADQSPGESSADLRARVHQARQLQLDRFAGRPLFCNSQMTPADLRRYCTPNDAGEKLLEQAMTKLALSARAYTRILKVGRTIADLEAVEVIGAGHIAEAIQYRSLDRTIQ